jgi:glycerophosphoryl diester phosphodiesterase
LGRAQGRPRPSLTDGRSAGRSDTVDTGGCQTLTPGTHPPVPPLSASRGVEVVGHRGASADAPEHTLAAYQQAVEIGADAVECDVRMTRDGVLVCVHDRRIDHTSTGRGVVSALTLADLERHSFGSRAPRSAPWRAPAGRRVPEDEPDRSEQGVLTLHRLLDYVTSSPGDVRLAIETKHPTRHSAMVERALVADLRHFGLLVGDRPVERGDRPGVRVMSFSPTAVRRVQQMAPGVPTVQLYRRVPATGVPLTVAPAIGPGVATLRRFPQLVRRAHARGTEVHVWVVNEPEDVQYVLDLGVDAVITDRPGAVLEHLGRGVASP